MNEISDNKKILITGASGSMGSQLVYELLRAGRNPVAHVRESSDTTYIDSTGIEKRVADLVRKDQLAKLVDGVDMVVHTAAWVDFRGDRLTDFTAINTIAALNLFRAAAKAGVKRFLHVSSVAGVGAVNRYEHGKKAENMLTNEESEYNFDKLKIPYFMTKRAAEEELFKAAKETDMELVVVNPSLVISPSNDGNDYERVLKLFNKLVVPNVPVRINMVDLRDVVAGTLLVLENGKNGHRYILAGDNVKAKEVVLDISALLGKIPHLVRFPRGFYDSTSKMWNILMKLTGRHKMRYYPGLIKLLDYDWAFSSRKAHEELGYNWRSIHDSMDDLLNNNFTGTYLRPTTGK